MRDASGAALLCELAADGSRAGDPAAFSDFAQAVADCQQSSRDEVRWVWSCAADHYPDLLRAGIRVGRCHDVALTEHLLLARDGRGGEPASLSAAWARLRGAPVPSEPAEPGGYGLLAHGPAQGALFETAPRPAGDAAAALDALIAVHADQLRRIATDEHPAKFAALVAAESAGGLAAAEMTFAGIPWRADVHNGLLAGLLGPRPPAGLPGIRPARLAELAGQISAALGGRPVNPDSPAQLVRALAAAGIRVPTTRSSVLREIDHPVIPPLLEYKELSRLHASHGWAWLDAWVRGGRFRPEYVVGGVVSGRWASRGGGVLQIPKVLRRAIVADPGYVLVAADAAQLEPRVLAALAGDRAFAEAGAGGDLYQALASSFGGDRAVAKIALFSAMYGGSGGEAGQLLAVLRRRFPAASGYVETAARAGEEGRVVRSVLGRTCPPPSAAWRAATEEQTDPDSERDPREARATRARGRFTRNFVVQASAADWALVLLAVLRRRLAALPVPDAEDTAAGQWHPQAPHLVFFQHDEVLVHCPETLAESVVAAIAGAAQEAGRALFGNTPVQFPMTTSVVTCYADAK